MNIKVIALLVGLATVIHAHAIRVKVFEKKGKYGLEDVVTGKVALKAKYDTIYPFEGSTCMLLKEKGKYTLADHTTGKVLLKSKYDSIYPFGDSKYALLRKDGKYGVIDNAGRVYLPCTFRKILFPVFTYHNSKPYFWASEDGVTFFQHSKSNFYTTPWRNLIYGPDEIWYGTNESGIWRKIVGLSSVAPYYSTNGQGPSYVKLPEDYVLFDATLYSPRPDRKKIQEKVARVDSITVDHSRFLKVITTIPEIILIDRKSGEMWKKSGKDLDGKYRDYAGAKTYDLSIKDNRIYQIRKLHYKNDQLYVINDPEYDLYGLQTSSSRQLLALKFSGISLFTHAGTYRGDPVWKLILNSNQPIFEDDLEALVKELKNIHPNFIIVSNSSMGSSLFGMSGNELVHFNLENLYIKDDLLIAKVDGEEVKMDMQGNVIPNLYDATWRSDKGNLTGNDLIVSKNGRVGLLVEGKGEIIPPLYEGFRRQWGHIYAFVDDVVGLYDDDGNMIIPPEYSDIEIAYTYGTPNFYKVRTLSGDVMILDDNGQVVVPAGKIDRANFFTGDDRRWCTISKNGKTGILDLQNRRIAIPCQYNDNIFFGNGTWPNRKIGVYRTTSSGEVIDIWTLGGKKISSRTFSPSAKYSMKHYLESQLNIKLYYE